MRRSRCNWYWMSSSRGCHKAGPFLFSPKKHVGTSYSWSDLEQKEKKNYFGAEKKAIGFLDTLEPTIVLQDFLSKIRWAHFFGSQLSGSRWATGPLRVLPQKPKQQRPRPLWDQNLTRTVTSSRYDLKRCFPGFAQAGWPYPQKGSKNEFECKKTSHFLQHQFKKYLFILHTSSIKTKKCYPAVSEVASLGLPLPVHHLWMSLEKLVTAPEHP